MQISASLELKPKLWGIGHEPYKNIIYISYKTIIVIHHTDGNRMEVKNA